MVGCFEDSRCFSDLAVISRLGRLLLMKNMLTSMLSYRLASAHPSLSLATGNSNSALPVVRQSSLLVVKGNA